MPVTRMPIVSNPVRKRSMWGLFKKKTQPTPVDTTVPPTAPTRIPPRTTQLRASPRTNRKQSPMRKRAFLILGGRPASGLDPRQYSVALYSVLTALQTKQPGQISLSPQKVAPKQRFQDAPGKKIPFMSLKVAKIINMTTTASPIRNPNSWARSDRGLPRAASIP